MNLQQLKVFVLTVKLKKLYLVASELNIRQPTVTFHLNSLQKSLGVPLFVSKSYHRIKLTDAGKALFHYAVIITSQSAEIESLMEEFQQLKGAKLSIGSTYTPATHILIPYLAELKIEFPDLSISLDVKPTPVIINKIKDFELDFGIITQVNFEDDNLIFHPLRSDDLVIVYYPDHPFSKIEKLVPADLGEQSIVYHEESSVSRKLIDKWASDNQVSLHITMETSGSEAMKEAVKLQMGYAILSESLVHDEVQTGVLYIHPIPNWISNRQIYLIREKNKLISPAMQIFLDRVITQIENH